MALQSTIPALKILRKEKKRYWGRRIANARAQQPQIPIEFLFLKKERGEKRKGEVREGGRKTEERIKDVHSAHLWALPLMPNSPRT